MKRKQSVFRRLRNDVGLRNVTCYIFRTLVVLAFLSCSTLLSAAPQEQTTSFDTFNLLHSDENFVIASLLVISPGDEVSEALGHAWIDCQAVPTSEYLSW